MLRTLAISRTPLLIGWCRKVVCPQSYGGPALYALASVEALAQAIRLMHVGDVHLLLVRAVDSGAPQHVCADCALCAGPKVQQTPACVLCPVVGPPLRRTSCSRFCHVGCAQWLAETFIHQGLVHGLQNVSKVRDISAFLLVA